MYEIQCPQNSLHRKMQCLLQEFEIDDLGFSTSLLCGCLEIDARNWVANYDSNNGHDTHVFCRCSLKSSDLFYGMRLLNNRRSHNQDPYRSILADATSHTYQNIHQPELWCIDPDYLRFRPTEGLEMRVNRQTQQL
uniref:Uncharacterized protein n=1 Tax=Cryptomonas curvata TaxID=233186 RepID=A0A7S0N9L0_9CRYP|mmetsp:Transcript_957/g.2056  ORF Transcript_957/g.2056 Transcript_957/m.2056 type:complete len:136 (+) Transcript_957:112-519(+)